MKMGKGSRSDLILSWGMCLILVGMLSDFLLKKLYFQITPGIERIPGDLGGYILQFLPYVIILIGAIINVIGIIISTIDKETFRSLSIRTKVLLGIWLVFLLLFLVNDSTAKDVMIGLSDTDEDVFYSELTSLKTWSGFIDGKGISSDIFFMDRYGNGLKFRGMSVPVNITLYAGERKVYEGIHIIKNAMNNVALIQRDLIDLHPSEESPGKLVFAVVKPNGEIISTEEDIQSLSAMHD